MRVPDIITASAVYLCVKDTRGTVIPAGTGFFLTVESETISDTHSYLVTARHCVEKAKPYGGIYVRLNNYSNTASNLIALESRWRYHEDEANDVAVLPFSAPQINRVMVFERVSLATPQVIESESIGIGDDLVVVGLFTSHYGRAVNRPIVRSGVIAAMPDEPIQDGNSGLYFDAFLAEVRSIGGLSGSPVWVVLNPSPRIKEQSRAPRWQFFLLGLIRGHWKKEGDWLSDFAETEADSLNTGIAMVTPIQKALDIIDSEELMKARKLRDQEKARKSGQVLDSATEDSEYDRFEDLSKKIVQVPKAELDAERKKDDEPS